MSKPLRDVRHGQLQTEGNPVKLQQLRYIVEVASCGSVTEAARRLFVSQPSVTAAVRDLEREMGITVFDRTSKGMVTTTEGQTFLGYARQVLEQADLLEERYKRDTEPVPRVAVSCQHYSFAVNAFVDVIRAFDAARYEFTLREEQTHEIIEDVAHMKSELGVIYLSDTNRDVIGRMLRAEELEFKPLFSCAAHVFLSSTHPLSGRASVTLEDLADYPYLSYEQGDFNSFYFSETVHARPLQKHPRARPRDPVQPAHRPRWLHGVLGRDLARAQRRGHHRRPTRGRRPHGSRHRHAARHPPLPLWKGVRRGYPHAYPVMPMGSQAFVTYPVP